MGDPVEPLRILIVDDFSQVRQDLAIALTLAGGVEVAGQASDGREAIELAARLCPDVVLMDLEMPVMDGFEAIRQVKALCPGSRVLALTVYGDEATRAEAFRAGADAFVVKGTGLGVLMGQIMEGEKR
jgi:DNA-binding NarL/FixJ family response regulator